MKNLKHVLLSFVSISVVALVGMGLMFGMRYGATYLDAKQEMTIQKMEDDNRYDSLKKVEDTARGMIASYEADLAVHTQYKDNDNEEKQSWGEQAKMRANRTASNYNNYMLKNSFVWKNNIPDDISTELMIIN